MGRFIQYYRENAKYLERTYGFAERVGIEHLHAVLIDDTEGICARLDAEIDKAVAAYRDPWSTEAVQPRTSPSSPAHCRLRRPYRKRANEPQPCHRNATETSRPQNAWSPIDSTDPMNSMDPIDSTDPTDP